MQRNTTGVVHLLTYMDSTPVIYHRTTTAPNQFISSDAQSVFCVPLWYLLHWSTSYSSYSQ